MKRNKAELMFMLKELLLNIIKARFLHVEREVSK